MLVAIAVLAFFLHSNRGLNEDEYTTWECTRLSLRGLVENRFTAGHFPTYFLLTKGWLDLLSNDSEWMMRLPSLATVLAALFCFRRLAADLFGKRAARLAGFLFLLHNIIIWTAQMARPYAGALLFGVLSAWTMLRWWDSGRRGWLVGLFLSSTMGLAFHGLYALTLAAFVLTAALQFRGNLKKAWPTLIALLLPLAVLLVPATLVVASQRRYQFHPPALHPLRAFNALGRTFFGDYTFWARHWYLYIAFAGIGAVTVGAGLYLRRARAAETVAPEISNREAFPRQTLLWCWASFPFLLLALWDSVVNRSVLGQTRYFVPMMGGMLLVCTVGILHWTDMFRVSRWRFVPLVSVLVLMTPNSIAWWMQPGTGPDVLARWMAKVHPPELVAGHVDILEYEYRKALPRRMVFFMKPSDPNAREFFDDPSPGKPFWLFVYDNRKSELDSLFVTPPGNYRVEQFRSIRFARAAWMVPVPRPSGS